MSTKTNQQATICLHEIRTTTRRRAVRPPLGGTGVGAQQEWRMGNLVPSVPKWAAGWASAVASAVEGRRRWWVGVWWLNAGVCRAVAARARGGGGRGGVRQCGGRGGGAVR